ncbi:hypothetical protein [Phyllobacterium zundukense]|uniref:Uncharacterized protein n=1 Tax=Phyllobacterium zundukense TaxID=1867719 RepID=A0ACD4CVX2_9HYPH|nr:hypothetical protein [Phyllobacterium zundukense]UXN57741.1 hypothetical protein N8E88_02715 [Phyllobacterium zundukense]
MWPRVIYLGNRHLLSGGFGFAIYLLPTLVPGASEAFLYMACGFLIVVCAGVLSISIKRREQA